MSYMFYGATEFYQNLCLWNTEKVKPDVGMNYMFWGTKIPDVDKDRFKPGYCFGNACEIINAVDIKGNRFDPQYCNDCDTNGNCVECKSGFGLIKETKGCWIGPPRSNSNNCIYPKQCLSNYCDGG